MDLAVATRPVRPDDLAGFYRMWPRLSRDTVYRRFHSPLHSLPPEAVRRFVTVDHDLRDAVVALLGDDVIHSARYDRSPADPDVAEFAILVEDAWQGMGLGRQLLGQLIDPPRHHPARTFTATVQPDNDAVIGLIRRLLPEATFTRDDDVLDVSSPVARSLSSATP